MKPRIEHVAEMNEAVRHEAVPHVHLVEPLYTEGAVAEMIAVRAAPFVPTREESLQRLLDAVNVAKRESARLRRTRTVLQCVGFVFVCIGLGMIAGVIFGGR
jgi:hypothetical protein